MAFFPCFCSSSAFLAPHPAASSISGGINVPSGTAFALQVAINSSTSSLRNSWVLQAVMNKKFDREPKYVDENNSQRFLEYQADSKKYMKSIEGKTFRGMRTIFLETFKDEREHPSPRISRLKEDRREWAFGVVERSEIDILRNKVVHKQAHRPTLQEIEQHDDLVEALYWLGEYLGVWDSDFAHSQFLLNRNAN